MRFLILVILGFGFSGLEAQILDPVSWDVQLNEDGTAIEFKATMKTDWVIYSQHTDPEGPIPLEFEFTEVTGAELEGLVQEMTPPEVMMSEMFDVEVKKFKKKADFIQKLRSNSSDKSVKGKITYMCCDATRCLPPKTIDFQVQ